MRWLAIRAPECFLSARLVSVAVVGATGGMDSLGARLGSWDGGYYLGIARHGYPGRLPATGASPTAFFPGYPALVWAAERVIPGPQIVAAVSVSLAAGAVAAVLIAVIAVQVLSPLVGPGTAHRGALVAVAAWSVQPASFVLSMAYSEGVFTAVSAGCLLALLRRRWWVAAILAFMAGAIRPTGCVLAACCLVASISELRSRKLTSTARVSAAAVAVRSVAPLAAVALAPLGVVAYLVWLGLRVHRMDAWFAAQRQGWHVYTDGGLYLVQKMAHYARHPAERPAGLAVIAVVVVVLVLLAVLLHDRPPTVLAVYTVGLVAAALTTHGAFGSLPRFFVPAFPLMFPIAARTARVPRVLLAGAFLVCAVGVGVAEAWVTGQNTLPP